MRFAGTALTWLVGAILGIAVVLVASIAIDDAVDGDRIAAITNAEAPGVAGGPPVRAYVARPTQTGPRPVVVMIHEAFGLNSTITGKADLLAREGYLVIAPDTFRGVATSWVPRALYQLMAVRPEAVNADIAAVVAWAKARPDADPSRVAIVGFCFGGRASLMYALHDPSVAATVVFYGNPETDPNTLKSITGPLLGIFGGADMSISPARVDAFRAGLEGAGVRHRVTVYDGQPHAFVGEAADVRAGGEPAKAWAEMVGFLRESLEAPRASAVDVGRAKAASIPFSDIVSLAIEHLVDRRSHAH